MPYVRRKRTFARKGRSYKGGSRKNGVAFKALRMARYVSRIVSAEKKFLETYATDTPGLNLTVTPLTVLGQGVTSEASRIGNAILGRSLSIKGTITMSSAASIETMVRVMLVHDRNPNGTLPTTSDILDTGSAHTIFAHYNIDNAGSRFKVLFDRVFTMNNSNKPKQFFSIYRKLNAVTKYLGTGASFGACASNHYYVCTSSDEGTNEPAVNYAAMFRFMDS